MFPNETVMAAIPDLLHATPMGRVDVEAADLAMVMAFAGGNAGGMFAELLERAPVAPSTFHPETYADDLFVRHFVSDCFQGQVRGATPVFMTQPLLRLIVYPPADAAAVDFRRQILWELTHSPELSERLEELYTRLTRLRGSLESASVRGTGENNRRQLTILERFRDVIGVMADGFTQAQSGLRRLAEFGTSVRQSEGFRSLVELLRYDEQLATVDFRVSIGADGRVRTLELLAVKETRDNVFVNPPWQWGARPTTA